MSKVITTPKRNRFTAKRKQEIVLRILRGESLDVLSRELSIPAATLSQWRDTFLEAGLSGLKSQPKDHRDDRIKELERKIDQITMDNELLYAKIDQLETKTPFIKRRLKRCMSDALSPHQNLTRSLN